MPNYAINIHELTSSLIFWSVAVWLFGAAVGASELIARYKDAPFRALLTQAALWYVIVNGVAAVVAFVLIVNFDPTLGNSWISHDSTDPSDAQKFGVQALIAGFSSMVFFRSSLFTMRVGDTDVAVGPGIFFQVLLFATDRACDRERAEPRSALVNTIMQGVSFEQARDALPSFCFELMQNVPASEQQQFRQVVDALASSKMRDAIKVLNLGLMLMNVVGSQVLRAAVNTLGEKIQGPAKLELEVLTRLQTADFEKAYPLLVNVCFIMSRLGTEVEQDKAKKAVTAEVQALKQDRGSDNSTKMTILGLSLQQRVGDAVLLAALAHVADGIQLKTPGGGTADAVPPAVQPNTDVAAGRPPKAATDAPSADVVAFPVDNAEAASVKTAALGGGTAVADIEVARVD
jgi:hypothetical protein